MSAPRNSAPPGTTASRPTVTQRLTIDSLKLAGAGSEAAARGPNAFFHVFFQLFKTAQIHGIDNQALQRPIQTFITISGEILSREGRISFQAADRQLFQNSVKLRVSTEEFELAFDTFEFFEERGIGGFVLDGSLDVEAVRRLLQTLVYAPPGERKFAALDAALRAAGLPFRINKTLGVGRRSGAEVVLERRSYTFFTYSKLVVLYRTVLAEERPNPNRREYLMKKISRTVQALVDICLEDDHTFLGVSAVKSGEAYPSHHGANAAVLAIALGEKLGLRKVELAELGMAALFHDVGMRWLPAEVLEKPAALDEGERTLVEGAPLQGAAFLLGERAFTRLVLSEIVTSFEAHRGVDGSGYPAVDWAPDLFSRIAAIACAYDALTTRRPWREAVLPDEALGRMLRASGTQFDPVLIKVFVNTMGLYPVGTLVRLRTGELGLVVYGGGEAERARRPIVALLGADGRPGRTVDLMEKDAAGGYPRDIVHSEDPAKYGLQSSGLLAESPGA
ncbi:MAG TPA: HD domain-containing phosphohydrolase [Vicinamibacteria bacterium]|jgi:HD-GYP domain-containing protein (c-di-GMP phosphodiesterase class II)|nr:HD domain-containing phosphohydrolase [Vicinamibacteria bacterium]